MEHPCYKCQTAIDESLPFCPHCGAPQIRVATPDEDPSQASDAAIPQVLPPKWSSGTPAFRSQPVQWELAWKGAFLSGLIAAVLTAAPVISMGCCLWLLGAGALAVWLYQRRVPGAFVTPGMGMRIGAVAGAVGFFAFAIWYVLSFVRHSGDFHSALVESIQKSSASNPDPRVREMVSQLLNNLNNPEVLATYFVLMLVIMAIVFVVFSAAGGALGASMFARRRDPR